jgi:hypothetical protein
MATGPRASFTERLLQQARDAVVPLDAAVRVGGLRGHRRDLRAAVATHADAVPLARVDDDVAVGFGEHDQVAGDRRGLGDRGAVRGDRVAGLSVVVVRAARVGRPVKRSVLDRFIEDGATAAPARRCAQRSGRSRKPARPGP